MTGKILERSAELRAVGRAASDAAAGHGSVLLVSGEAGIGKSSIVVATRAQLPSPSRLLVGHCDDLATARPLGPLHDIAQAAGEPLRQALADNYDREALLSALRGELADHPGTVLVVEDVHWADHATLDVLRYLVRRIDELPAVLMLTYRDDEIDAEHPLRQLLGAAARAGQTHRLPLAPLSPQAVAELCREAGVDERDVHATTSGNPFYVAEVLATGSAGELPQTVVDAVLARVRLLDPAVRDAVEQLSVLPTPAERWLADLLLPQGFVSIAEAEERGLLRVAAQEVTFRHELARRAVADALAGGRRLQLEARVLTALQSRDGVDPARLAHHAAMAGDISAVSRYAPLAARAAARSGAHREAAAHYRRALEHTDGLAAVEQADLFEGSAIESYLSGTKDRDTISDQRAVVRLRRSLDDQVAWGASLRWLSRMHWLFGDRRAAEQTALQAVAVLEHTSDRRLLALAYSNQSQLLMLGDHSEEAVQVSRRAIELAREVGDWATLSHALCNYGTATWQSGDRSGEAALIESLDVALEFHEYEHASRAYCNTVWRHLEELRPARARDLLSAGLRLSGDSEHLNYHAYLRVMLAMVELSAGDFDAATSTAQDGLSAPDAIRCAALTVQARAAVRRGTADPAQLAALWELADHLDELQRTVPAATVLAEDAWLRGGSAALREPTLAGRLARLHAEALRLRRPGLLPELAYWLHHSDPDVGVPGDRHPYSLQQAGRWVEAAAAWELAGYPYESAAALAESGAAADALAALTVLDALGAEPLAARIRQRLRARGTARVPRGPQPATRANPYSLTARQAEVAELLAERLTNAQIAARLVISERTADHHVAAVLDKLDVRTRADAVARLTQRQTPIQTQPI